MLEIGLKLLWLEFSKNNNYKEKAYLLSEYRIDYDFAKEHILVSGIPKSEIGESFLWDVDS